MGIEKLLLQIQSLDPPRLTATQCGHRTKHAGGVSAFGKTVWLQPPKNDSGSTDYCLECIGKMTIRCAWCGEPIFVGEPITLFAPVDVFDVPEHAVLHRAGTSEFVGCLRFNCAESGALLAGFWHFGAHGQGSVQLLEQCDE